MPSTVRHVATLRDQQATERDALGARRRGTRIDRRPVAVRDTQISDEEGTAKTRPTRTLRDDGGIRAAAAAAAAAIKSRRMQTAGHASLNIVCQSRRLALRARSVASPTQLRDDNEVRVHVKKVGYY